MRSARPSYSEMVGIFLSMKSQYTRNNNWLLNYCFKINPPFWQGNRKKRKEDFLSAKRVTPPEERPPDPASLARWEPQTLPR